MIGAGATVLLAVSAGAQDPGGGFLFGAPTYTFTVRAGYANARAGSDIFSFATQQLTLTRNDFSAPSFDAEARSV